MSQPTSAPVSSSTRWRALPPTLSLEVEKEDPSLNRTNQDLVATIVRLAKSLERRERELEAKEEESTKLRRRVEELEGKLGDRDMEAEDDQKAREAEALAEASRVKAERRARADALMKTIEELSPSLPQSTDSTRSSIPSSSTHSGTTPSTGLTSPTSPASSSWPQPPHQSFSKQVSPTGFEFPGENVEQMRLAYEQRIVDLSDRLAECHAQLVECRAGAAQAGNQGTTSNFRAFSGLMDRTLGKIGKFSLKKSVRGTQSQPVSPQRNYEPDDFQ